MVSGILKRNSDSKDFEGSHVPTVHLTKATLLYLLWAHGTIREGSNRFSLYFTWGVEM